MAVLSGCAALLIDHGTGQVLDGRPLSTPALDFGLSGHFVLIGPAFAGNGHGGGNGGGGNGNGNGGGNGGSNGGGSSNAGGNGNGNNSGTNNAGGLGKALGKTSTDSADTSTTGAAAPSGATTNAGHDATSNEVLAVDTDEKALAIARNLGFAVIEQRQLPALGIAVLRLRTPANLDSFKGLALLRTALPGITADVNALYQPYAGQGAGETELASLPASDYAWRMIGWPESPACGAGLRIGLIDTAIAVEAPVLSSQKIHQRSFVDGESADSDTRHGTAIASLLVGQSGGANHAEWDGLLPSAELFAASVFERHGNRSLASAVAIAEALDWLVAQHVPVINISLSGAPNLLMETAVRRTAAEGTLMVAAAGNYGPSAPPAYPGAYPGVIAVTAVDQNGSVFDEANQGSYIAFSAPGVRIWAPGGGAFGQYLTGTSFAAPFVAAAATLASAESHEANQAAISERLAARSTHLGSPGRNPVFGYGLIRAGASCQTSTASVE